MRPDNADLGYVWDMLQAAHEVVEFIHDVDYENYVGNLMLVPLSVRSRLSARPRTA